MNNSPIGFIGLGNMGAPMAANLAGAGWSLTVPSPPVACIMMAFTADDKSWAND